MAIPKLWTHRRTFADGPGPWLSPSTGQIGGHLPMSRGNGGSPGSGDRLKYMATTPPGFGSKRDDASGGSTRRRQASLSPGLPREAAGRAKALMYCWRSTAGFGSKWDGLRGWYVFFERSVAMVALFPSIRRGPDTDEGALALALAVARTSSRFGVLWLWFLAVCGLSLFSSTMWGAGVRAERLPFTHGLGLSLILLEYRNVSAS